MKTIDEVKNIFEKEFNSIRDKFSILTVPALDAAKSDMEFIWHPGVYVWWHPGRGVLKVGRHLTNSRKRALEHVRDDTGGKLKEYGQSPKTKLILFNVKDQKDFHWVAAVEIFLEKTTKPHVPSQRQG